MNVKSIAKFLFNLIDKSLWVLLLLLIVFILKVRIPNPDVDESIQPYKYKRIQLAENHYSVGNNWLKKNSQGIWEMYIEGEPYERGLIYGVLAKELIESQEAAFVGQINELIPSSFFQQVLRMFIAWFNRDMDSYVPKENLEEIYGVSKSFSDEYDYIGPKFYRILYYHAAHDIGHALTDLKMVGCTSFSVKQNYSEDGELLIGRNFDFYMGEQFAVDKLLLFVKPSSGIPFATYSWAGLTGVVSGMNKQGLTVTLNASKSDVPFTAKEPISVLARKILQYANNINEAVEIAKSSETFVSESLLIGSAADNNTVIIEKGPNKMDLFYANSAKLVCSNHYQSKAFENELANTENMSTSDSKFRWDRTSELIEQKKPLNTLKAVEILRDKQGAGNVDIGLGNAQALNQLIAHHAVIFKPKKRQLWVSTSTFQLGEFIAYDLNTFFNKNGKNKAIDSLAIPVDSFIYSAAFTAFKQFKFTKEKLVKHLLFGRELSLTEAEQKAFIANNPASYEVYTLLGKYSLGLNDFCKAKDYFELSLSKTIASKKEEIEIKHLLKQSTENCKK